MRRYIALLALVVLVITAAWADQENAPAGQIAAEPVIDLDLSECNKAITCAQLVQALNAPEQWVGKVFRVNGQFNYSEKLSQPRIIFTDNSGCCELALDFQPAEALTYPQDYPPLYARVELTARFVYDPARPEGACYFADAAMVWGEELAK